MNKPGLLCLAAALALVAGVAHATTYTYSTTVDFSGASFSGGDAVAAVSTPAPSFSLVQGDTISGTVTFANNEAVTVGSGYSYLDVEFTDPSYVSGNAMTSVSTQVTLNVVAGTPSTTPLTLASGSAFNTLGAVVDYLTTSTVTFTGFEYTMTLTSGTTWGVTTYTPPFTPHAVEVENLDDNVSLSTVTPVPEPVSAAMLGVGMAGAWLVRRRRRALRAA